EVEAACVEARIPAAIVGNGKELPLNPQLRAREVFVQQPDEQWTRPRAPFRFHGVKDRKLAPPSAATDAWSPRATAADAEMVGERPLAGLRVVDFTAFWAGPFATAWLCAMGAEVIKIEAVQRPDGIRFNGLVPASENEQYYELSGLYQASNLGKR